MTKEVLPRLKEKLTPAVIIAFVVGTLLGLVVLGWWLWPVQWVNADFADLRPSLRESVLQMTADSFAITGDAGEAQRRLAALAPRGADGAATRSTLERMVQAAIEEGDAAAASRLQNLAALLTEAPPSTGAPSDSGSAGWIWAGATQAVRYIGIAICLGLLAVGLFFLLRAVQKREAMRPQRRPRPRLADGPSVEPASPVVVAPPVGDARSLGHFESTYRASEENYDVSYGIDSASGEFLGECGVSALESIAPGGERRVPGLEVWLFDKEDHVSVAKVLTTEWALQNDAVRQELMSKGELVPAREGQVIELETANLLLRARVVEIQMTGIDESEGYSKATIVLDVYPRRTMQ